MKYDPTFLLVNFYQLSFTTICLFVSSCLMVATFSQHAITVFVFLVCSQVMKVSFVSSATQLYCWDYDENVEESCHIRYGFNLHHFNIEYHHLHNFNMMRILYRVVRKHQIRLNTCGRSCIINVVYKLNL